jgi:hypothetical protein
MPAAPEVVVFIPEPEIAHGRRLTISGDNPSLFASGVH